MNIQETAAIDVHCHYGLSASVTGLLRELESGNENTVLHRMDMANIRCSIVSPLTALMPRGGADPVLGNEEAWQVCSENDSLFQWVVVDPQVPETYEQAERLLGNGKCLGIKVHPEEHLYPIKEYGQKIFEYAAGHKAVVQSHSGEQRSNPLDFVEFADAYPEVKLVLAHIGCNWDGDVTRQVRAIQAAKNGNIYADTSSAKSLLPGLIEWAVKEAGPERILFGTDSPLYFAPMMRARIDKAEIDDEDKENILYRTALDLFGGKLKDYYYDNK